MDRQPHALHLLEIGQHVLLTLLRHIQIHFIQRCLPQPVHEIIEVRLDLHPIDLSVKLLRGSFQNGKAGHTLGPVLFQLFQNGACVLLRSHHSHKALNPLGITGAHQHLFEDSMSARHHKDIDDGHKHQKIAGVQHGGLGQRQAGRINESQQKIEPHRNLNFTDRRAVHDILALIKCKKGQNIGQQQQETGLYQIVQLEVPHLVQNTCGQPPRQPDTESQREQINQKQVSILQFFTFRNHTVSLSPFIFTILSYREKGCNRWRSNACCFCRIITNGSYHFTKAPYRAQNGQQKSPFSRITQEKGRSQALFSSGETPISSSQRST